MTYRVQVENKSNTSGNWAGTGTASIPVNSRVECFSENGITIQYGSDGDPVAFHMLANNFPGIFTATATPTVIHKFASDMVQGHTFTISRYGVDLLVLER